MNYIIRPLLFLFLSITVLIGQVHVAGTPPQVVIQDSERHELVPFINRTYRVIPDDRTIIGLSFSGLFSSYVLFKETDLFNRYVIVSPSLWWDNGVVFHYESDYHDRHAELEARLYMAAGEDDGPAILRDLKRMEEVLSKRER